MFFLSLCLRKKALCHHSEQQANVLTPFKSFKQKGVLSELIAFKGVKQDVTKAYKANGVRVLNVGNIFD